MKIKNSNEILNSFSQRINYLEKIRNKQEQLYANNQLLRREIEEVYASLYLDIFASFEGLIEDLFFGLMIKRIKSSHSNINPKIVVKSPIVARDIIFRGRKYYTWLPYENTERIARIIFKGGKPFILKQDEKRRLEKCLLVRNVIAHHSRYAMNQYRNNVLIGLILTPRDRQPKSFLRCQFSLSPPMNYYQQLVGDILQITKRLC